jgi:hypothetical protein
MFRILCDPSSGSTGLCLTEIHRYFIVCLIGVWQRNFEPVVFVYGPVGTYTHIPPPQSLSPRFDNDK